MDHCVHGALCACSLVVCMYAYLFSDIRRYENYSIGAHRRIKYFDSCNRYGHISRKELKIYLVLVREFI